MSKTPIPAPALSKYEEWVELTVTPPYPCYECYVEEEHSFCTRRYNQKTGKYDLTETKAHDGNICNCQQCWPKTSYTKGA